jgi:hypothetical protein
LWELLYAALTPLNDPDPEEALLKFCQALCAPMQPVYDLVRERDGQAGWAIAFDVDNAPAFVLPWLAQFVGCVLTPDMSESEQRDAIRQPSGWSRGRQPSVELAGKPTLTGTQRVVLKPRTPEVGVTYVRTLAGETPDPACTEARFRAALPAWELLDYAAFTDFTLADFAAKWKTLEEGEAAYETLEEIVDDVP